MEFQEKRNFVQFCLAFVLSGTNAKEKYGT